MIKLGLLQLIYSFIYHYLFFSERMPSDLQIKESLRPLPLRLLSRIGQTFWTNSDGLRYGKTGKKANPLTHFLREKPWGRDWQKSVQIVLQHYCKTSWIAMLRVLPPTKQTYLVKNQLLFLAWKEPSKLCSVTTFLWKVDKNLWSLNKASWLVRKLIWRENMACSHATTDLNFIILFELYFTFILRILHRKISLITWPFKYA